jgi:hypothetical protein
VVGAMRVTIRRGGIPNDFQADAFGSLASGGNRRFDRGYEASVNGLRLLAGSTAGKRILRR